MSDENGSADARDYSSEQLAGSPIHHPLVALVLAQKTVRCNTFYEEQSQEQPIEAERQVEETSDQDERGERSLFGSVAEDSSTNSISAMGCLKGAYDAYKYVNQVRSHGTYVGMVGSVGLIALKAIATIYSAQKSSAGSCCASGMAANNATSPVGSVYWIVLGAAIGIAIHSEARWWLTDQDLARKHLFEAQRLAHVITDGEKERIAENRASSKDSAPHGKHHKHRRRKRDLGQQ